MRQSRQQIMPGNKYAIFIRASGVNGVKLKTGNTKSTNVQFAIAPQASRLRLYPLAACWRHYCQPELSLNWRKRVSSPTVRRA
jgi:hypothetical protein